MRKSTKKMIEKLEQLAADAAYLLAHRKQIVVLLEDYRRIDNFDGLVGEHEDELAGEVDYADGQIWSIQEDLCDVVAALDKAAKLRNKIIKKSGSNNALSS